MRKKRKAVELMRVSVGPGAVRAPRRDDVLVVPESDVSDDSSHGQVDAEVVNRLKTRERSATVTVARLYGAGSLPSRYCTTGDRSQREGSR
jgi:hypothetical protein